MSNAIEQQAVELRQEGMSYANIMKATGLPERKVKALTKGVTKVKRIDTPFAKAVERVFTLAVRPHGIRDYELRDILHQEYGSTWDTTTGQYVSNYDSNVIKRVREKVRLRAALEDCNALFTMDWVDEDAPTAGREFLEASAADLMSRIEGYVNEFMEHHATRWREDSEEADQAQRKQLYAAKRHLLKLAVKDYGKEPLDVLLERSVAITDALEGTLDAPIPQSRANRSGGDGEPDTDTLKYYPEPSRTDPFLDFVASQGWLKEVEGRFI
ncbi:hypothetical protein [Pseudomonas sp. B21-048]|uniref:hypothetical protein n=1 Tax=Pseudomonas sp. B21-048 TaxID=2895490 RepID=UPI00215F7A2F|nr:hypothetical protein [Pseudomonas sp. B21-048]UVK99863.1 hypothetical protein LOY56_05580 [Pseudomonas sp. B21-048]